MVFEIKDTRATLVKYDLDGWLMADCHGRNEAVVRFLGLDGMLTRRWFYFVPAHGDPTALVNPVEKDKFGHLPGRVISCAGYAELEKQLGELLAGVRRVAMEYSPKGRLAAISPVDAGSVELVRQFGPEVVSSADLLGCLAARLSPQQIAAHRQAADLLIKTKTLAFEKISDALRNGQPISEYDVCRFILDRFRRAGMVTEHGPNCSVGVHSGDPHYEPSENSAALIERGQPVLIDLWAKGDHPNGVYADITWMAFAGAAEEVPAELAERFALLARARDGTVAFLKENIGARPVSGCEVDDRCREIVAAAGYGDLFSHRTGHSVDANVHGVGPNMDNFETEDRRLLQEGHLFTLEPGLYSSRYGVRTEINVLVGPGGAEVTTLPLQREIIPLL
jgi:Xaa-Pro aminopeptidase